MRRRVQLLAAAALISIVLATSLQAMAGEQPTLTNATQARIVNITSDSARGWSPSVDQARSASEAALAYLTARDTGRAEVAYGMLEDGNRALQLFTTFSRDLDNFNKQAGSVLERRIVNVTWTKDPAQAPKPGVYAAIDLAGRFANIDRDCGYVVVYQPPAGGPFRISREEANFMTNADAAAIERQQSKAGVEAAWSQLSAHCPNYSGESASSSSAPLSEQAGSIGYPTVASALIALRSRADVTFRTENGWTIATDRTSKAIWVFTSEGQPAYPAAVKRQIVTNKQEGTSVEMSVLCESSKVNCDNLVRIFVALNDRMAAELKGGR